MMGIPKLAAKKPLLRLVKKKEPEDAGKLVYGLLSRYERTEIEIARIKNTNANVFDALEQLEAEQKEVVESIKRVTFSKNGPPPEAEGKLYSPAQSQMFRVEVMYPQSAGGYEPALLPKELLLAPGIVTSVDNDAINLWLEEHPEYKPIVDRARTEGQWLTPRCSIKRLS